MPSGPRCQPTGQARPTAIGWQNPPGPRHQPGPHPSAACAAPANATTPRARDALKIKLFMRSIPPYETLSQESARIKRQPGLTEHERMEFRRAGWVAIGKSSLVQPSLRVNGSDGCPPDDKLREAIQSHKERLDCFVASAPRKDENQHPTISAILSGGGVLRSHEWRRNRSRSTLRHATS